MYFDRNATQSAAKRQFSRWGGGSGGMDRRSNAAWVSPQAVNSRGVVHTDDSGQGAPLLFRLQDAKDPFVSGGLVSGQSSGRVVHGCRCGHLNLLQPAFVVDLSGMAAGEDGVVDDGRKPDSAFDSSPCVLHLPSTALRERNTARPRGAHRGDRPQRGRAWCCKGPANRDGRPAGWASPSGGGRRTGVLALGRREGACLRPVRRGPRDLPGVPGRGPRAGPGMRERTARNLPRDASGFSFPPDTLAI